MLIYVLKINFIIFVYIYTQKQYRTLYICTKHAMYKKKFNKFGIGLLKIKLSFCKNIDQFLQKYIWDKFDAYRKMQALLLRITKQHLSVIINQRVTMVQTMLPGLLIMYSKSGLITISFIC